MLKSSWDKLLAHGRAGAISTWDNGTACSLLSAVIFSLNTLFVKLAHGLPSTEIVFVRSVLSIFLCLLFASRTSLIKDRLLYGHLKHMHLLASRGLFGASAMQCQYLAVKNLPLGDAVTLFFLNPALTALAAWLILREKLSILGWLGVAVSLAGLLLLTRPPVVFGHADQWDKSRTWGTFAGVASAVFAAGAFISIRLIGTREPALVLSMWFHTTAMFSSVPPMAASWPEPAVWPSAVNWVILIAISFTSFAGQMMLTRGFQLQSGARASGLNMTQVVFGYFYGFVFFNEQLDSLGVAGSGFVAVGAIMVNLKERSRRQEECRIIVPPNSTDAPQHEMALAATTAADLNLDQSGTISFSRDDETQYLLSITSSSHHDQEVQLQPHVDNHLRQPRKM